MAKRAPLSFGAPHLAAVPRVAPVAQPEQPAPITVAETPAPKAPPERANGRSGLCFLGGYFTPEAKKQFKLICLEEDKKEQELLAEALNDLFQKRGKTRLA